MNGIDCARKLTRQACKADSATSVRPVTIPGMLSRCGWSVPVYFVVECVRGTVPAGFILTISLAVLGHVHGLTLLMVTGCLILFGEVADSVSPGMRAHILDKVKLVVEESYLETVAYWDDLSVHESPELVRRKSNCERAISELPHIPVYLGFVGMALFSLGPMVVFSSEISPWLPALVLAGSIPVSLGIARMFGRVWDARSIRLNDVLRAEGFKQVASERSFAKELRTFGMQRWVLWSWRSREDELLSYLGQIRRTSAIRVGSGSVLSAGAAVTGVWLALTGEQFSAARLIVTLGLLLQVRGAMNLISQAGLQLAAARKPVSDYLHFVNEKSRLRQPIKRTGHSSPHEPTIEFKDVFFFYAGSDVPALEAVSFRLDLHGLTLVVGPNGAGKSTLMKLVGGLYEISYGRIDGVDREAVAFMQQEVPRMPLTVRENVTCGTNKDDSDSLIWDSLSTVGLRTKAENLPLKLDTPLYRDGDGEGSELSGGQWQRLALARTLYCANTRPMIILDEPTSSLDALAETQLLQRVLTLRQTHQILLVTHRMSWAPNADRILLVRSPNDVVVGTHPRLLESDNWYRQSFKEQAEGYLS
jgi:ATP-binding cassette subfamily B protein